MSAHAAVAEVRSINAGCGVAWPAMVLNRAPSWSSPVRAWLRRVLAFVVDVGLGGDNLRALGLSFCSTGFFFACAQVFGDERALF